MFPTFLGIAAPRAGSTWLYELLSRHPDVGMSAPRKEVHYFDLNFDRGTSWYERFFSGSEGALAVGEFTPTYLYGPMVPERIETVPTIDRFVLILRNPVDRAFSHYLFRRQQDNRRVSFEEFLRDQPNALGWGMYGRHLSQWFERFDRSRFLVLIHENAIADVEATKQAVARHIGVDPARFPVDAGHAAANTAFDPDRPRAYAAAVKRARWLRRHDLDVVVTAARRTGVVRLLKRARRRGAGAQDVLSPGSRDALWPAFEADVRQLETVTGLDLDIWRSSAP